MHSVSEAQAALMACLPPSATELVALEASAGRMLAQDILADRDGPPFDRVCMDGIAIPSQDLGAGLSSYQIVGLQLAGHPPLEHQGTGTAIEVATGAVLPLHCDQVIRYEDLERHGQIVTVAATVTAQPGRNIQAQGAAYRAGEILLPAGCMISSPQLHCLASAGYAQVSVRRRLSWALIATGDELIAVADQPAAWQIRRSNDAAIVAEAHSWGLEPSASAWLPDQEQKLQLGLSELLAWVDILVLTGGVSHGAMDLIPRVLQGLGANPIITGIRQKPGKPFWCGTFPNGKVAIGLPGNPVSSLFCFRRLVLPWLLAGEGRSLKPGLVSVPELPIASADQTLFVPVERKPDGRLSALSQGGSGDYRQLVPSTGFVELAPESVPGELVPYHPWGIPGGIS